jgi:hypothetical protein
VAEPRRFLSQSDRTTHGSSRISNTLRPYLPRALGFCSVAPVRNDCPNAATPSPLVAAMSLHHGRRCGSLPARRPRTRNSQLPALPLRRPNASAFRMPRSLLPTRRLEAVPRPRAAASPLLLRANYRFGSCAASLQASCHDTFGAMSALVVREGSLPTEDSMASAGDCENEHVASTRR